MEQKIHGLTQHLAVACGIDKQVVDTIAVRDIERVTCKNCLRKLV